MKLKIDAQLYKTIACLNQSNKEKLLVRLDQCKLLQKDSDIFLENSQTLQKENSDSPE